MLVTTLATLLASATAFTNHIGGYASLEAAAASLDSAIQDVDTDALLRQAGYSQSLAAELAKAITKDANGQHHLYFHALAGTVGAPGGGNGRCSGVPTPDCTRCGEVDAAPFMPAGLFEQRNIIALAAYAEVTIRLYNNPRFDATKLALGRCAGAGFPRLGRNGAGELDGVSWWGQGTAGGPQATQLMAETCGVKCKCNFRGSCTGSCPGQLPDCKDVPDDPAAGTWCSLCGPTTACPGCRGGYKVEISLWFKATEPPTPAPSTPAPSTIVDKAVATPELSTLVAALTAADLVGVLSSPGPFTVFAPTNAAFAAIQPLVNKLLLPANKALLAKLLTYHVLASKVLAAAITNGESVATVEGQKLCFEVNSRTKEVGVYACGSTERAALVVQANVLASNGVGHLIDQVLVPVGFLDELALH